VDVSLRNIDVAIHSGFKDVSSGNIDASGNITGNYIIAQAGVYGSYINEGNHRLLPPGVILPYGASVAPLGFLLCDGSAYSRATYADLFAVIGTTYSASDASSFRVPDMRLKMPYYGGTVGTTGGASTVTLNSNNLPAHTHTGTTNTGGAHTHSITDPGHTHVSKIGRDDGNCSNVAGQAPPGDSNDGGTGMATYSATTGITIDSGGSHTHTFTTDSTGSGTSFSILNPYMSLTFIIKY